MWLNHHHSWKFSPEVNQVRKQLEHTTPLYVRIHHVTIFSEKYSENIERSLTDVKTLFTESMLLPNEQWKSST